MSGSIKRSGLQACILLLLVAACTVASSVSAQELEHLNVDPDGLSPFTGKDPFISSNGRFVVFIGRNNWGQSKVPELCFRLIRPPDTANKPIHKQQECGKTDRLSQPFGPHPPRTYALRLAV